MEISKRILVGISCVLVVVSCEPKAELKIETYSNGQTKSEVYYLNDTTKHGLAKTYYPSGTVKDEIYFENGKKNGVHKHYFPSGKIEAEIPFVDDYQQGRTVWYYENGSVQSESNWVDGKEYGSTKFYFENGNLERYQCKDFYQNVSYLVKLNDKGEKIKEEGVVFSPMVNITPGDTSRLNIGEEITFRINVPEPPDYKPTIWIRYISGESISGRMETPVQNSTVEVKRTFDSPGKHGLIIIGELRAKDNTLLLSDSILRLVTVVNKPI